MLNVRLSIEDEDANVSIHQSWLLLHPDNLLIMIGRLHAITGYSNSEIGVDRDFGSDRYHLIFAAIEKDTGTGGGREIIHGHRTLNKRNDVVLNAKPAACDKNIGELFHLCTTFAVQFEVAQGKFVFTKNG